MFPTNYQGAVEVICGCMFSGKTEELLRRVRRATIARQKVQVFKPKIDNRYSSTHVESHDSNRSLSTPVGKAEEILKLVDSKTRLVGIDEVQFFDMEIISIVQVLADRGVNVIVAGLDMDYRGEPFGPMPWLLSIAESVTKLSAVCVMCGGLASRTQLLVSTSTDSNVVVGGTEMYEARCRNCHEPHPAKFRSRGTPELHA